MTQPKEITCDEALKSLLEFLDRELDTQHHAEVEQHLHRCRACYSRAEFEKRLKGKLGELGREEASPPFVQRIRKLMNDF